MAARSDAKIAGDNEKKRGDQALEGIRSSPALPANSSASAWPAREESGELVTTYVSPPFLIDVRPPMLPDLLGMGFSAYGRPPLTRARSDWGMNVEPPVTRTAA